MSTIQQLQDECVKIFGLEHKNTQSFFRDCESVQNINLLKEILEEMKLYEKINDNILVHIIVEINGKYIVVVEMANQSFDFYATAFVEILKAVKKVHTDTEFIQILDIIERG